MGSRISGEKGEVSVYAAGFREEYIRLECCLYDTLRDIYHPNKPENIPFGHSLPLQSLVLSIECLQSFHKLIPIGSKSLAL